MPAANVVINARGNSSAVPCSVYCGPLDLSAWYDAAERELQRAQAWRPSMSAAQANEHDRLLAAYRSLPPRVAWPTIDAKATTTTAANLAQSARDLWRSVEASRQGPNATAPDGSSPSGSGPSSGIKIPGLPSFQLPDLLPDLQLPNFDLSKIGPILILALIALAVLGADGPRRPRA